MPPIFGDQPKSQWSGQRAAVAGPESLIKRGLSGTGGQRRYDGTIKRLQMPGRSVTETKNGRPLGTLGSEQGTDRPAVDDEESRF